MTQPAPEPAPKPPGTISQLFLRYRHRAVGFARRLVRSHRTPDEPDDLVQEASAEFLKKPRTYRDENHFLHLFLGFVFNAFRGSRRKSAAAKRGMGKAPLPIPTTGLDQPSPVTGPETAASHAESHRKLLAHLDQLKPEYRAVIELRLLHALPWDEIARRIDVESGDTARKRYEYAIEHWRARFQPPA